MEHFKPPEPLSLEGNLSENWRRWKQRFELYRDASGISGKEEKTQAATLLHVVGAEALEVYNNFTWDNDGDNMKVEQIMAKFEAYCNPRKNVTWERHVFNNRNQLPGEPIDHFVTDLRTKAKTCEFGTLTDSLIRDRIVEGVLDDGIRSRLLRETSLTLQKALDICRSSEAASTQMKSLTNDNPGASIATINQRKPTSNSRHASCGRCGGRHPKQSCPAIGAQCHKCGLKNHFSRMCRTKANSKRTAPQQAIHHIDEGSSDEDTANLYVCTISNSKAKQDEEWRATLILNDRRVVFKLDTGAECNVISKEVYDSVSKQPLQKTRTKLVAFGGHKLNPCGKAHVLCEYKGRYRVLEFMIVDGNVQNVLGKRSCSELKLVKRVDAIERCITDDYADVFQGLGCIKDVIHHIKLDENARPVVHPPRRVPITLRSRVKDELDRMEALGVAERVHEPSDWVNSMVTVIKPNGKLRICIDPRDLNKAIKREHFPTKTVEEVVARMPNAKIFSVLDASSGFWQIELDQESSKLCTFNTPFGRYRFKRLPFGICSAQDVFQDVMSEIFSGIEGIEVIVDDLLIWGENQQQHDERLRQVLERARQKNLKLNKEKSQIALDEISYIGHVLSKEGLKPDPQKVRAITEMNRPQNKEELQRFLGMVTYVAKFIPNFSQISTPLRQLLEKETDWHWTEIQEESFNSLKTLVTQSPVLRYFDVGKPVKISVDASSGGLGAVLLQNDQPVAYASKALSRSQINYAQIEKEMLAVVFGCTRFHDYIYGLKEIQVETDHKPLESILKKPLHQAPMRLQRMILQIQKYPLIVTYRPGKELLIADTLSRAYLPDEGGNILDEELEVNLINTLPISENKLELIKYETLQDPPLQQLKQTVITGWPERKYDCPHTITPYWNCRDEISVHDGILFKGERVIIPKKLQPKMLQIIHGAHLGVEKCKRRARDVLYWPGMNAQVEDMVLNCQVCAQYRKSNRKEPLLPHDVPQRPWAKVGGDLFEVGGQTFMILVDYYSGFFEIDNLKQTKSENVIRCCKAQFARYGIPDTLITDNGPQFSSTEFRQFSNEYQFKHKTSSPHYPQSNGMAERAVQTAKRLLIKAKEDKKDPYLSLLDLRNTPKSNLLGSPAQRLMGRRTKTLLPTSSKLLEPKVIKTTIVRSELQEERRRQKQSYDRHAKELTTLQPGQNVRVQFGKQWRPAVVTSVSSEPRSYNIKTPDGQTYRRNRRHLMESKSTGYEQSSFDDNWPGYEPPESDPPPTEPVHEAPEQTGDNSPGSNSVNETSPPLRRSQRNTHRPARYADTWGYNN